MAAAWRQQTKYQKKALASGKNKEEMKKGGKSAWRAGGEMRKQMRGASAWQRHQAAASSDAAAA